MSKRLGILPVVILLTISTSGQKTAPKNERAIYSISGSVVGDNGQALANAEIYLGRLPENAEPIGQESLLANGAGRFRFTGLLPGKYGVLAAKKGYIAQPYGTREGYVIGIAVGPGVEEPRLVLRLQAEGSIFGTVRGDDDVPLRGAEISLFRSTLLDGLQHTIKVEEATSRENGGYRFSHQPPGKYYLVVKVENEFSSDVMSPFFEISGTPKTENTEASESRLPRELDVAYPVTFFPNASKASNAQSLTLHAGEKLRADFCLQAVPAIHLKVPSGVAATLRIQTFEDAEMDVEGLTIPSGDTEWKNLAIAPGNYSVLVQFCNEAVCVNAGSEMELAADTTVKRDEVVDHRVTISGTATPDDGSPVSREMSVSLAPLHSVSFLRTMPLNIGEDGRLDWSGYLPPGRYALELQDPALSIKNLAVNGARVRGNTLEARADGSLSLAFVITSNKSRVRGRVVNAGNPVAGAMVLLVPKDFESETQLFRRDESDSDGTFSLRPVPAGNYIVIALEHGWDIEWANPEVLKPYLVKGKLVRLTSGATAEVTLELQ